MPITEAEAIQIRRDAGMTQEEFAAHVGVSRVTINRIENGVQKPLPVVEKAIRAARSVKVRARPAARNSRKSNSRK